MKKISKPIEQIKSSYQVVIIGSGYGGSIAASRLARAGQKVCLLERGNEIRPGEYPNTLISGMEEMQINSTEERIGSATAMIDFNVHPGISVVTGCGLGGTSLINANVSIRPDYRVFKDPCWPTEIIAEYPVPDSLLNKGYDLAEDMLKTKPLPDHIQLDKLSAFQKSAQANDQNFYRPNINVNFEYDGPNHVGVVQKPCNLCGDCCSGCNNHAKNTLLMNYLPDAHNHGAEIFTGAKVKYVEKKDKKWIVHFEVTGSGTEKFNTNTAFVFADIVIVSAGTLGTAEIMLRSKANGLKVSERIGHHFSGNGDVLGFGYNTDTEVNDVGYGDKAPPPAPLAPGPCITGIIDLRNTPELNDGMIIEDAAAPGAIAKGLPWLLATTAPFIGVDEEKNESIFHYFKRKFRSLQSLLFGAYTGAVRNTQVYLVMAHDLSKGKFKLVNDRLSIDWPGVGDEPIFKKIDHTLRKETRALNGEYIKNPSWTSELHNELISVHPLGGCCMGNNAHEGVVNHKGQVFTGNTDTEVYENIYITDGSVIPRSVGVNPLITISAVSERCIALIAKDRGWKIDYTLPAAKHQENVAETTGIEFAETMKGFFTFGVNNNDYQKGYDEGKAEGNLINFTLNIRSENAQELISNPEHNASIIGTVTAPGLSPEPLTAMEGLFNLFVYNPDRVDSKLMKYAMKLITEEGKQYYFKGYKLIEMKSVTEMWHDTTTLYVTLFEGDSDKGKVIGQGIMTIALDDFIKQLETIKSINAPDEATAIETVLSFQKYFAVTLFDEYGGIFVPDKYYDPEKPPRKKRKLNLPPPEYHPFKTADGVSLMLTRYFDSTCVKGPVMFSHGFSGSSLTFNIDTIDENMAEYFYKHHYDVWLIDYRQSNLLPSSKDQSTVDQIAEYDYPAAVELIKSVTGKTEMDVVVHCVGSIAMFMALLKGTITGIRSVVAAQIACDIIPAPQVKWKCGLYLPELFDALGVKSISAYVDEESDWENKLFDKFLKLYAEPLEGYCTSPTCHRLTFMFGPLYEHDKLNDATHTAQVEMFQIANVTTYEQLAVMVRANQLLTADGNDIYMPNMDKLRLPITFIHGAENQVFDPESTLITYNKLIALNGDNYYARHVIEGYGHNDCLYGKNSNVDVFPLALHAIEMQGK
jgi:cholesterol oxidase